MSTTILTRLSWVFLLIGAIALMVFIRTPDIHQVPQAVLLGVTAMVGAGTLRLLAYLLRPSAK